MFVGCIPTSAKALQYDSMLFALKSNSSAPTAVAVSASMAAQTMDRMETGPRSVSFP
jgi:hypothetical protein